MQSTREAAWIVYKWHKKKLINMDPAPPALTWGHIKIYKPDSPFKPSVIWQNAPGHNLAELTIQLLSQHTQRRTYPWLRNCTNETGFFWNKRRAYKHSHYWLNLHHRLVAAAVVVVVKIARDSITEPNTTQIITVPLYLLTGLWDFYLH